MVHIADLIADPEYTDVSRRSSLGVWRRSHACRCADAQGGRACRRDRHLPPEVRPFTDKQIELVQNFAPRRSSPSRTRGCSTSCANRCSSRPRPPTCWKVIRSSTGESGAGVRVMLDESAARLCGANLAAILRQRGRRLSRRRDATAPPDYAEYAPGASDSPRARNGRWAGNCGPSRPVHIADVTADHAERHPAVQARNWAASGPCSLCRCSRRASRSE